MPGDFHCKPNGLRRQRAPTLPRRWMLSTSVISPAPTFPAGERFTMDSPPPPQAASLFWGSSDRNPDDDETGDGMCGARGRTKRSGATVSHGLISLMGRRREMADAVTAVPTLFPPELLLAQSIGSSLGFFAVYDGHGGPRVAEMCKERLHHLLAEEIGGERWSDVEVEWEKVMRMSFARMDREACERNTEGGEGGGGRREVGRKTSAVVVVVSAEELVVANCGGTRAVLCRGGIAIPLSRYHEATPPSESESSDDMEEAEAADGSVIDPYTLTREDNCLRPHLTSIPEPGVGVWRRSLSDEFVVVASDGLWDVLSSDMACELVKRCLFRVQYGPERRMLLEESSQEDYAAAVLAATAVARGSDDNVSIIVVMLTTQV